MCMNNRSFQAVNQAAGHSEPLNGQASMFMSQQGRLDSRFHDWCQSCGRALDKACLESVSYDSDPPASCAIYIALVASP